MLSAIAREFFIFGAAQSGEFPNSVPEHEVEVLIFQFPTFQV